MAGSPCLRGVLLWSVVEGVVHATMAANGLFGWIAFGHANPGGAHRGTHEPTSHQDGPSQPPTRMAHPKPDPLHPHPLRPDPEQAITTA